mgnify:CR=1 FL=1
MSVSLFLFHLSLKETLKYLRLRVNMGYTMVSVRDQAVVDDMSSMYPGCCEYGRGFKV